MPKGTSFFRPMIVSGEEDQRADERAEEDGEQHAGPSDEDADHRHHLDVAAAHRILLEDEGAEKPTAQRMPKPIAAADEGEDETVHGAGGRRWRSMRRPP